MGLIRQAESNKVCVPGFVPWRQRRALRLRCVAAAWLPVPAGILGGLLGQPILPDATSVRHVDLLVAVPGVDENHLLAIMRPGGTLLVSLLKKRPYGLEG